MTTTAEEPPYFPATAPAELSDADTAVALLDPVLDQLAEVVTRVTPERLGDPTPCARFDLATLRDHVLGWLQCFESPFVTPSRGK